MLLRIFPLLLFMTSCSTSRPPQADGSPSVEEETVVLLHGMGRSRLSMVVLSHRFKGAGYRTLNFPHSQANRSLDELSGKLVAFIKERVKTPRYHLVAHSLGNVIIRNAFRKEWPPGLGRIVMLAPPNQPAHLAKRFKKNLIYRLFTGDSGQKLSEEEFYAALPVPKVDFGVIAGGKGQKLTFSEPNDGLVTVESTKLDGMKDFIVLNHAHTFIMNCKDTFEHCKGFIETGSFVHPEESP
jgi:triacylglycerol lipase